VAALGWTTSYAFFAGVCLLGSFFIFFVIPETKGKTSEEIEIHFNRKSTVKRVSLRNSLTLRNNPEVDNGSQAGLDEAVC